MAKGFCVCHRTTTDPQYLPAPGAAWHYLCDKPVLPPFDTQPEPEPAPAAVWPPSARRAQRIVPTGTGWPVTR